MDLEHIANKCGFSDTGMQNRCSQLVGGDKDSEFYYQNLAKNYQNLQEYPQAIENIDKAITKVSDTDYKSSFLWNKACILHDMEDKECLMVIQKAIDMRQEDKAKEEWKEMLNKWAVEFKSKEDGTI